MSTDDLVLEVPCAFCKAEAGHPCRTWAPGYLVSDARVPHLERIQAYYRALR